YEQHLQTLAEDQPVVQAIWPEMEGPEQQRGRGSSRAAEQGSAGTAPSRSVPPTEQQMRDLLGRFGLVGDQVYQRVGDLSGGERGRVALARLVAGGANVLVLDEPTNHLDLWACDALEQALLQFEGTVIVVSHDRHFLNRVVDQLIVLEGNGRPRGIHGNYDTYEPKRALQHENAAPTQRREHDA